MLYTFALPIKADKVPAGPDWLHEVKYDGYRMMLIREQGRVRLIDQTHAALLADKHHTVAVVLHFVQPVGACGHLVRFDGQRKRVQHSVGRNTPSINRRI